MNEEVVSICLEIENQLAKLREELIGSVLNIADNTAKINAALLVVRQILKEKEKEK